MVNHSSVRLHFNQGHHSPGKGEAVVYLTTPLPFFGLFADSVFPLVQMTLKRGSCAVVAVLQGARGGVCTGHVFTNTATFHPPLTAIVREHAHPLCCHPRGARKKKQPAERSRDVFMGLERSHCGCEVGFACRL